MSSKVLILNYEAGNLNSIKKALDRLKVESVISAEAKDIAACQKIILPGVGHFKTAMSNLRKLNLLDALREAVLIQRKSLLGICLGMQLLVERSEEGGGGAGLGWFNAEVVKFKVSDNLKYKIPHIGWNRISVKKNSPLMRNISDEAEFYFVHSYHVKTRNQTDLLNETKFDYVFPSAIEKGNIFGVQYHPEKSRDAGAQVLKNFIEL